MTENTEKELRRLEREISYLEVDLIEGGFNRSTFRELEAKTIERLELFKGE